MTTKTKVIATITTVLLLTIATFIYVRYFFVFAEGVKAGELNYFARKGYIFKTYEGKVIQSGFDSRTPGKTIQSYEFVFSVTDKAIADSLMQCSGKHVELHYKEYFGKLPWRGFSTNIVDKIISVQ